MKKWGKHQIDKRQSDRAVVRSVVMLSLYPLTNSVTHFIVTGSALLVVLFVYTFYWLESLAATILNFVEHVKLGRILWGESD